MATTTTNYGFDVPQSSDLVKNGATQIALLGQDLDTFLFRPFTRNVIINGAMDIWQRGTSIALTSANTYCVDRFIASANTSGASTVSRQATNDTTNLPFIQYCARFQRNAGNTATGIQFFNQPIESANAIPLAGKTVTVSFYARAGANFSSSGNVLTAALRSGTGTDQNYLDAWTGDVLLGSYNATLTTTWQRFTFSVTVGATATELTLPFTYTPTGTAGANDYYEITGVQLEAGNQATPFTRASSTGLAGELAACQRYYYRQGGDAVNQVYAFGNTKSTTDAQCVMTFPVTMRTPLTSIDWNLVGVGQLGINIYQVTPSTGLTVSNASKNSVILVGAGTGFPAAGTAIGMLAFNSSSSYIGVSAEL
jgi:hypothetical protein